MARARRDFHLHREHLEARFIKLASSSGKPRGLDWVRCEFDDSVMRVLAVVHSPDAGPELFEEMLAEAKKAISSR